MAKKRTVGRGAKVSVSVLNDTTYIDVGAVTNVTPPPQEKAVIDKTAMEDTVAVGDAGIEQLSEFVFESFHDPSDATDDAIDALYGSNADAGWRIDAKYSSTQVWRKAFTGIVTKIVPTGYDGNGRLTRNVTVVRTGAITDTIV